MDSQGLNFELLSNAFILFLPKLGAAILIFVLFWIASLIAARLLKGLFQRRRMSEDISLLLGQVAQTSVIIFGLITALGTLGIDVAALVAGLGLTGFALGFALKDAVSNFLAGFLILYYEPFQRGDTITASGQEGLVTEINMRYTVLKNPEKTILIPNSALINNAVIIQHKSTSPGA
jgi:small conductance mechanosensitive channel